LATARRYASLATDAKDAAIGGAKAGALDVLFGGVGNGNRAA